MCVIKTLKCSYQKFMSILLVSLYPIATIVSRLLCTRAWERGYLLLYPSWLCCWEQKHESVLCLAFVMVFISGPCVELCWSHRRIFLTLKCKTLWLELAFACVTLLSTNFSDPCKCCWSRKPDPLPQRREGSGGLRMQAMSRRNAISWMTYPDFEITCCEVRTLSEPYISTTLR